MKVAIFKCRNEIIVLPIKGKKRSVEAIDGYKQWFGASVSRDIDDFDITMGHIGAGSGLHFVPQIKIDWFDGEKDITDWFYDEEEE